MRPPLLLVTLAALTLSPAFAQKPPALAFPPINPGNARAAGTLTGLEGLGAAVAATADDGLVVADGARLLYWKKEALAAKPGGAAPAVWSGHQGPVLAVAAGGATVASAGTDGKILLWDLGSGKAARTLDAGAPVRALAVTADGKLLASAGDDATVQVWDVAAGRSVRKLTGAADWLVAVAFSADGKAVAAGGYDGKLRLWEAATGRKLVEVPAQPPAPPNTPAPAVNVVWALAFSPDGKLVAAGGSDTQVHLFQAADGKLARSLAGHTGTVTGLAFHPAGALLASAGKDRTVRLWNPAGGAVKSLEGHTAWVQGLTFLARGTRLASVGADRTVRLWDLADPPKK